MKKNSDQEVDVYFIYSPIPFLSHETNVQNSDFRHFFTKDCRKGMTIHFSSLLHFHFHFHFHVFIYPGL